MGEVSTARMVLPAALVGVVMAVTATILALAAGVDGRGLIPVYTFSAAAVGLVCLLVWIGHRVIAMARAGEEEPIARLRREVPARLDRLLLPALVAPLFLAAFTTAKTCIARLIGFRWDAAFTELDAALFGGTDPWVLTHAWLGTAGTLPMAFFYTIVFGLTLAFVQAFVALFANRRLVGTFFLATTLTWFWGGTLGAYALSSAGPVFAYLSDPALQERFAPLTASLHAMLAPDSSVRLTQAYLASAVDSSVAVKGGGISAMPSMHIAAAMLYVLAARGTRWQWLAVPFLALTWLGSVHLGYHYAIDGLLAIPIALLCWLLAERFYRRAPSARLAPAPAE